MLLGGTRYDESPLSDATVSMQNVVDVDKWWYTLGAGYKMGDFFETFLQYGYCDGDDTIGGVDYRTRIHHVVAEGRLTF